MILDRRTFCTQLGLATAGLTALSSLPRCFGAQVNKSLPRSTPEAQGVASAGILAFLEALGKSQHEFHSFMLVRHGHVIAEGWWSPYGPKLNHTMYSMSKSFTSTAIGFAVAEKKLTVNDSVVSFFPKDLPEQVSENLAALRVKDLLTMSVGHAQDSTPTIIKEEDWVKSFLSLPIPNKPGSAFLYNSGATYMCSAIVQKVSGQRVLEYLTPRLFEPLGIEGMTWESCPRGINMGGWGLSIQTEGLAKFGQLYLQKGVWQGKQILPAKWVEEATSFKIQQPLPADATHAKETNDWVQGYCYQFWRCRHNGFRGDGAFGQYTIVLPEQDAVIAITGETSNMQGELDLAYEHLLPAMKEKALPADAASQSQLNQVLSSLALTVPKCNASSSTAAKISGKSYKLDDNSFGGRSVSFVFDNDRCTTCLIDDRGKQHSVTCGIEKWVLGEVDQLGAPPSLVRSDKIRPPAKSKIAASGTWRDDNTFEVRWQFFETPHHDLVTFRFEEDKVQIEVETSLKEKRPPLIGRLAS